MELLIAGPGCFNGLGKYFVSHKILRVSASAFHIHTDAPEAWCLDGEKGATGDVFVRIHPHALRIYSL
jgi:diacylglycerol kinase family enzyme